MSNEIKGRKEKMLTAWNVKCQWKCWAIGWNSRIIWREAMASGCYCSENDSYDNGGKLRKKMYRERRKALSLSKFWTQDRRPSRWERTTALRGKKISRIMLFYQSHKIVWFKEEVETQTGWTTHTPERQFPHLLRERTEMPTSCFQLM